MSQGKKFIHSLEIMNEKKGKKFRKGIRNES